MSDPNMQDLLTIDVNNFGPIAEARVDLRPLTVFVGPSNTGKSYLAILIYALHKIFGGNSSASRRLTSGYPVYLDDNVEKLPRKTINTLIETATQIVAERERDTPDTHVSLSRPILDAIRSRNDRSSKRFDREIRRCFGIDKAAALIRKGCRNGAHISLHRHFSKVLAPVEHKLVLQAQECESGIRFPDEIPVRTGSMHRKCDEHASDFLHSVNIESPDHQLKHSAWKLIDSLAGLAMPHIAGPLRLPAFYLPADRTGVMHAHGVVVGALIESAAMTGIRSATRTPMLSGVMADFLEQLIELDHPFPPRRHSTGRDVNIETAILEGSVRVHGSEMTGYPRFTYRPKGWNDDLSLMNASSMVSELAPIVLYLRHLVEADNLLIVEEPESHLHPAMQVEFTRQLAMLVHSGVRVIITTHSEWLLEELANIVRRSELPQGQDPSNDHVALRSDQVGAWLFRPKNRPKGSVVKEIRLDDSGLYPSDFDEVATTLHNDWAEISSQIENGS